MSRAHDISSLSRTESSAVLMSICLFPNSTTNRDNYLALLFVYLSGIIDNKENCGGLPPGNMQEIKNLREKYADFNKIYCLFNSQNTNKLINNISDRVFMFAISGNILDIALMYNTSVRNAAMLYSEATQENQGVLPFLPKNVLTRISKDEDNIASNIWPEFKDVAHIAAAMIHLSPFRLNAENIGLAPSIEPFDFHSYVNTGSTNAPSTLKGLLTLAEGYRQAGIRHKVAKSSKSFLSDDSSWQIKPFFDELPVICNSSGD